ncbi:hypothetical protein PROVRETT_07080 [Providencia rettgeri DSM 1131]|nr:hypothetical protein PROVRETT_07080 [Providencia rettgeri DSM 1131]
MLLFGFLSVFTCDPCLLGGLCVLCVCLQNTLQKINNITDVKMRENEQD